MKGLTLPISVGDNCEFNGIIYHIEGIQHTAKIGGKGERIFRTVLQLSSGVAVESEAGVTEFAEMTHTDADKHRISRLRKGEAEINDPGVSDSQDLPLAPNRSFGDKTDFNREKPFDTINGKQDSTDSNKAPKKGANSSKKKSSSTKKSSTPARKIPIRGSNET